MSSRKIGLEAITLIKQRITDEVFLAIQDDRILMHKYLRAVENEGLDQVNRTIGKSVKEEFNLNNIKGKAGRQDDPMSTLIQSHQMFD
jgi:hypothetical protein